ncbi:MAG TPA: hypothetical protein VK249_17245 [Anaerolineales bacterium]|nr:hypothetical protein [Anaerolineales bacterium]
MNEKKTNPTSIYRIKIQGALKSPLADWLGDLQIIPQEGGATLLVGHFADQPALRGLLDQLWNLNFVLLSVERIENQSEQHSPQREQEGTGEAYSELQGPS